MNIRMYDCKFGDCFQIESETDSENALFVDFGIHSNSCSDVEREKRYCEIIDDMPENMDFLLSHYHADHYEGVYYMSKQYPLKKFRNVYIPDVWSLNCSIKVVYLNLLKDLLTQSYIRKGVTLFQFLSDICTMGSRVYFISTGKSIQNQYTALWPDLDSIKAIPNYDGDYSKYEELSNLSSELVEIMRGGIENSGFLAERAESVSERLNELNERFLQIRIPVNNNLKYKLAKWENDISIVFHSKDFLTRKVLFCGDVSKKYWRNILINKKKDLYANYEEYDVIKIPHHGTEAYYYDFTDLVHEDSFFLIPNGNHCSWKKYYQYSLDAGYKKCRVICSNTDYCEAVKRGKCNCTARVAIEQMGWFCVDVR